MARPKLKDVAALAGVSEPTVSRVLNGRTTVAEPTRAKVVDALHQLGYTDVPEPREARRGVVGIVAGDFLNPVFGTFVHHLSTELGRKGFLTNVVVSDPDLNPEERCIGELVNSSVDGIVFIGGSHAQPGRSLAHYEELALGGLPMVLVNGMETGLAVPHVRCDEEAGARKAVTHLLRLGHRRIGCLLGTERFVPTRRFIAGYRATLADAGVAEPEHAIVETTFTLEGGRAGATRLLDAGCTAILAGNDLIALGAVLAGKASGRHIPDEMSVVGYDGTDMTAFTSPPLTTLRQPFEDMAQLIAEALFDEMEGSRQHREQYVFEPQLVVRESTGGRPADAPLRSHPVADSVS